MKQRLRECHQCGHENPRLVSFCQRCGASLRRTCKHRAFTLVEGTAGVGKTTLVDGLIQHQTELNSHLNTLLRLGQGHTYAPLDPDNVVPQFTAAEQMGYLQRILTTLEFLSHPNGSASKPPFSCIIETLHLTLAHRPNVLAARQIVDYDRRLAAIGCKLIFIKVNPETHWKRCIWERRHNGFITRYGQKYGDSLEEIHAYYVEEQERMMRLFEASAMEKQLLDGERPPHELVKMAYDFWIQ